MGFNQGECSFLKIIFHFFFSLFSFYNWLSVKALKHLSLIFLLIPVSLTLLTCSGFFLCLFFRLPPVWHSGATEGESRWLGPPSLHVKRCQTNASPKCLLSTRAKWREVEKVVWQCKLSQISCVVPFSLVVVMALKCAGRLQAPTATSPVMYCLWHGASGGQDDGLNRSVFSTRSVLKERNRSGSRRWGRTEGGWREKGKKMAKIDFS